MKLKHSIMLSMLGRIADRFHEYHPPRNLRELLKQAQKINGVDGIEVVYPTHFTNPVETIHLIKESGLPVSALNLNVKSEKHWEQGSFTSSDGATRRRAVEELKKSLDLAAELGTDMVSLCPLIDGHNYNFEVDHLNQWGWLEEGIAEGAAYRSDVRLSLEYKLNESRNFNILGDVGRTLYLCERIGLPHVGITIDLGHALIAKEAPAQVLCMAANANRLFYLHFNDNTRDWDWDMLPGAVNFWDLLETLYYIERLDWNGWISYDVVTRGGDLVESMDASISILEDCTALIQKYGIPQMTELIKEGSPACTFKYMIKELL